MSLGSLVSDTLDNIEIEIEQLSGFGLNWSPNENAVAHVSITNNTGFTIRDFHAFIHNHSSPRNTVSIPNYPPWYSLNEVTKYSDFLPGETIPMYLILRGDHEGHVRVHLHYFGELILEQTKYDDLWVEADIIPD